MFIVETEAGARSSMYSAPPVPKITDRGEGAHQPGNAEINAALLAKCCKARCVDCGDAVSKGVKRCADCDKDARKAAMKKFFKKGI